MVETVYKRSLKNYLLQPVLQSKLGLYCILASIIFTASVIIYGYSSLFGLYEIIVELTDISDDLSSVIQARIMGFLVFCAILGLIYTLTTLVLSIYYTHRFVGPVVAFRRHVTNLRKGDFSSRVVLRKNDAFAALAEDLNMLASELERSQIKKQSHEAS